MKFKGNDPGFQPFYLYVHIIEGPNSYLGLPNHHWPCCFGYDVYESVHSKEGMQVSQCVFVCLCLSA